MWWLEIKQMFIHLQIGVCCAQQAHSVEEKQVAAVSAQQAHLVGQDPVSAPIVPQACTVGMEQAVVNNAIWTITARGELVKYPVHLELIVKEEL